MIKYNSNNINDWDFGTSNIVKVYHNNAIVFYKVSGESPTPPSFDGKWLATYSGGTTSSAECDSSSAITVNEIELTNLESVVIGDCVTSIGEDAFYFCTSLTSIDIPSSVTSIGKWAFEMCASLSSVTIGSGVTSIGDGAFYECTSLTSVTIPNSVTSIDYSAFHGCTGLTSITIPSGVTNIGKQAFQRCSGLTSITVNATTPPTLGSYVFDLTNNCPIYVPCESVSAYKTAWSDYASRIQECPTPTFEGKWKATYSGGTTSSAACDSSSAITSGEIELTNLESVVIGDCVTSIGYGAFQSCTSLASVTIPSGVTSISSNAFYNCRSLTNCTIGDNVTNIDYSAFRFCSSLTSIDIPSGVTSIGNHSFRGCSGLTSITVEATTPPALGSYAFDNTNNCPIYVPSESVETYKAASGWSDLSSRIQAIP